MSDPAALYTIEFAPRTEDQLKIIPKKIKEQIFERIEGLKKNPRPENVEPLHGADKGLYRVRQGDYRIVYSTQDHKLLILIVRVVNRKEVYKKKHSK
jgi:mRNA interferase RelE/StbE